MIVSDPITQDVDPSTRITVEVERWDQNVVNKLVLPVM